MFKGGEGMHWYRRIIFAGLLFFLTAAVTWAVKDDYAAQSPLEWINAMENAVNCQVSEGSLLDRISRLEVIISGKNREGSLVEKLSQLQTLIFINQPHDISLIYKIQALEWVLFKEAETQPLKLRVGKLEKSLLGETFPGPLNKRLDRMMGQVFPDGTVKGHWVDIPEGLLIKIHLTDALSSAKNKPGDSFQYVIDENVIQNDWVLFMKGTVGTGVLQEIERPQNLGRNARLLLDFDQIRALDGTMVDIYYGKKAMAMNRSGKWAFGASAAGMLAFGPGGILLGLAVKGEEEVIPAGTEFYLQVREPVRIYTLTK